MTSRMIFFAGILIIGVGFSQVGLAQPPQPPADGDAVTAETPLTEQTIYIPYEKLRDTFEKEGRGVFLPYDKFQQLWEAARRSETTQDPEKPAVDTVITAAESTATVGEDVVQVTATLQIEVLTKGWKTVPLRLGDAAIRAATIDGQPARVIAHEDGYALLLQNQLDQANSVELNLEYVRAFAKSPGRNSVAFAAPQAPVNRWRVIIPRSGVKVEIHPMIAATESQPAAADTTELLAFVGSADAVRIDWTPKAEGASGLEALVTVRSEDQVFIEEGVIRTRSQMQYDISRAELAELTIEVPADQRVVNVFDANIRRWNVEAGDETQTVNVELFEPTQGTQNITVELEKFVGNQMAREVSVANVKAVGVGRQQGVVVVRLSAALKAEPSSRSGLLQIDAEDLPEDLRRSTWNFMYRYGNLPFELGLNVEKVQPRIRVNELVEVFLEPEKLSLSLTSLYTIERAGVFQLNARIPAGFRLQRVTGAAVGGAEEAAVDSHYVSEDGTMLTINLARKAMGQVGVLIELQQDLTDPNLLAPTGAASDLAVSIPGVVSEGVEQIASRLIVYSPESLRVVPTDVQSLRAISVEDAISEIPSARGDRFATTRPVLTFAYSQDVTELSLSVERRKPYVTVAQWLDIHIESGVTRYTASFFADIRYSGVKSLRVDLPASIAGDVRNLTSGIRESTIVPAPDDVPEGYQAWRFAGETELLGPIQFQLTWETTSNELEIGKTTEFVVPVLKPAAVDRAWGQITIGKEETIDVRAAESATGLRPIDPQQDVMPGATPTNAAQAFEFHDDWSLTVLATRYQLEDLKRTSTERGLVRMVVTRSNQVAVQAIYRIRSVRQRLAVQLPSNVELDMQPLRINGAPITLEVGDKNAYFIPLAERDANQPFLLDLRYTISGGADRLELPEFLDEPAVQKVYVVAYLPKEIAWVGTAGPWTDEMRPVLNDSDSIWQPTRNDESLLYWVAENISDPHIFKDFQVDGTQYVFSTLQPATGAAGALQLKTINRRLLTGLMLVVVLGGGLLLVGRPLSQRLAALFFLVIVLVLIGVFAKTLALQLLGSALAVAVALVILLWVVCGLVRWTRRNMRPTPTTDSQLEAQRIRQSFLSGTALDPGRAAAPPPTVRESNPDNVRDSEVVEIRDSEVEDIRDSQPDSPADKEGGHDHA